MTSLAVTDLRREDDLTQSHAAEVEGGFAGFLSGLFAGRPGGAGLPSITQNFVIDFDQTIVQQNPVNLTFAAGDGGANVVGDINVMNVNTGSINVLDGALSA